MKAAISNTNGTQKHACKIWDNVKNPVGVVQIIQDICTPVDQYEKFAKFLNKNRYIVFCGQNYISGAPARRHQSDAYSDIFMMAVNDEIQTLEYLMSKYKLPVFLLGHGYGSFITQRVMESCNLCAAGVCLAGGVRFPTWFLRFGAFLAWVGMKQYGANATSKLLKKIMPIHSKANTEKIFPYGFYYSLFHNLIQISYNVDCRMPILIISGGANLGGQNASLANALYKTYQAHNMEKLTVIIYPDAWDELMSGLNYIDVQRDVLDFFNSIQCPQNAN